MYVHETGSADQPAIVFLHGNGANGLMWKTHLERLTTYHCFAPDFPGFGQSNQEAWVSLDETAGRIIDLIRQRAKGGRAHVVGLSLGSSIAITLLGEAPDLIDHAVIDGAGVLPLPGLPLMKIGFRLLQPFLKTEFVIRMIANSTKIPADEYDEFKRNLCMMSSTAFTRAFLQALSLRQPAGLEQVNCPVLFVAGEKEPKAVHQSNVLLANVMPKGQIRIAPGMGHGWLAEAPYLHCRMVQNWIEDRPLPQELVYAKL
jgi:pimeloyl-ACP methyl ester carboxylesterase